MIPFRLVAAAAIAVHSPGAPLRTTFRNSALVLLLAAVAFATALGLAGFGLFAALRIAHGHAPSLEWSSAAAPFDASLRPRSPGSGMDPRILVLLAPRVFARLEAAESASGSDSAGLPSPTAVANAEPEELATASEPGRRPTTGSASPESPIEPAAASAGIPERQTTGGLDPAAQSAPASKSEAAPQSRAKPRHAVKHVAHKRIRRIAHRPAYSNGALNAFQPMFNARTAASPFQPMFNSR